MGAPLYTVIAVLRHGDSGAASRPKTALNETDVTATVAHSEAVSASSGSIDTQIDYFARPGKSGRSSLKHPSSLISKQHDDQATTKQFELCCNLNEPHTSPIVVRLPFKHLNLLFDGHDQRLVRIHLYGLSILQLRLGIHTLRSNRLYDLYHGFGGTDYGYLCPRSQVYIVSVPGAILICTLTETQFEELKNNNSTDEIKNGKLHLSDITFKFKDGSPVLVTDVMLIQGGDSSSGLVQSTPTNWNLSLLDEALQKSLIAFYMSTISPLPSLKFIKESCKLSSRYLADTCFPSRSDVVITGVVASDDSCGESLKLWSSNVIWMESHSLLFLGCTKQELLSTMGPCDYVRHDCTNRISRGRGTGEWAVYNGLGAECLLDLDAPLNKQVWLNSSLPGHPMFAQSARCRALLRLLLVNDKSTPNKFDEAVIDLSKPWNEIKRTFEDCGLTSNENVMSQSYHQTRENSESPEYSIHYVASSLLFEVTDGGFIASVGICTTG